MSVLDWAKIGCGAIAGALVAASITYPIAHWRGHSAGYEKRVAETAAANIRAELQRKGDDAKLQGMSDYDLCAVGLRGGGLPIGACEQLRGLHQE